MINDVVVPLSLSELEPSSPCNYNDILQAQRQPPIGTKKSMTTLVTDQLDSEFRLQQTAIDVIRTLFVDYDADNLAAFGPEKFLAHDNATCPQIGGEALVRTPSLVGSATSTIESASRPSTSMSSSDYPSWAQVLKKNPVDAAIAEVATARAMKNCSSTDSSVVAPKETINRDITTDNSKDTKTANPTAGIKRNSYGQRIDIPTITNCAEIQRVKSLKLCNVFYLRGTCSKPTCTHDHDYQASALEIECLKMVARMAPCNRGSSCDSKECIYGHSCPAARTRKGELCVHGKLCKFPVSLHNVPRD